jgi:ribosomal protein L40E
MNKNLENFVDNCVLNNNKYFSDFEIDFLASATSFSRQDVIKALSDVGLVYQNAAEILDKIKTPKINKTLMGLFNTELKTFSDALSNKYPNKNSLDGFSDNVYVIVSFLINGKDDTSVAITDIVKKRVSEYSSKLERVVAKDLQSAKMDRCKAGGDYQNALGQFFDYIIDKANKNQLHEIDTILKFNSLEKIWSEIRNNKKNMSIIMDRNFADPKIEAIAKVYNNEIALKLYNIEAKTSEKAPYYNPKFISLSSYYLTRCPNCHKVSEFKTKEEQLKSECSYCHHSFYKICPICGAENAIDATICEVCGGNFSTLMAYDLRIKSLETSILNTKEHGTILNTYNRIRDEHDALNDIFNNDTLLKSSNLYDNFSKLEKLFQDLRNDYFNEKLNSNTESVFEKQLLCLTEMSVDGKIDILYNYFADHIDCYNFSMDFSVVSNVNEKVTLKISMNYSNGSAFSVKLYRSTKRFCDDIRQGELITEFTNSKKHNDTFFTDNDTAELYYTLFVSFKANNTIINIPVLNKKYTFTQTKMSYEIRPDFLAYSHTHLKNLMIKVMSNSSEESIPAAVYIFFEKRETGKNTKIKITDINLTNGYNFLPSQDIFKFNNTARIELINEARQFVGHRTANMLSQFHFEIECEDKSVSLSQYNVKATTRTLAVKDLY